MRISDWSSDVCSSDLELEDFRSKAHISWRPATDYTADHLVPFLQKEAKKSPAYRKAMKMMPWVIAAVCVVAYFGLRLFSAVDVSAPIASREGVVQRAAALVKYVRYADFMQIGRASCRERVCPFV